MTNLYYGTVKQLLERISSVMIDREAIQQLVGLVKEALKNGPIISELGDLTIFFFPAIFPFWLFDFTIFFPFLRSGRISCGRTGVKITFGLGLCISVAFPISGHHERALNHDQGRHWQRGCLCSPNLYVHRKKATVGYEIPWNSRALNSHLQILYTGRNI